MVVDLNLIPEHFFTRKRYTTCVVDPIINWLAGGNLAEQNKLDGIKFHLRMQKYLHACRTLADVISIAFGPKLLGETHVLHRRLMGLGIHGDRDSHSKHYIQYDTDALKDAVHFIQKCANALGIEVECDNYAMLQFANTVRIGCVIECPTKIGSYLSHKKRRPDCVIYASHKDSPYRVWQCVIEIKTLTNYKTKNSNEIHRSQISAIEKKYEYGSNINNYTEQNIFQAIDTTTCVCADVNSQTYPCVIDLYSDAFLWVGYKATLKAGRPSIPISCSQHCSRVVNPQVRLRKGRYHKPSPFAKILYNVFQASKTGELVEPSVG